ncbi:MAG TPA: hypothetical protein VK671_09360 [Mucilaginibacter sp.]|jgi:hypothetical protein|nr:hypothetical protein [Mucilaginibacter sp.]
MKKFIELTGLDDYNNLINVLINVNKIAYMCEIDGKCNENSALSTIICLDNNTHVSVIEDVFAINEIIEETSLIEAHP